VPSHSDTALATIASPVLWTGDAPLPVPWRDPQTVAPDTLAAHIERLERACAAQPRDASLRTCLGMAYAMRYDVDGSMASLQQAVALDPRSFWAQLKLAELHYRLRILNRAEEETLKALDLARNPWEYTSARRQLGEIRTLLDGCVRNVEWSKPLTVPALALAAMLLVTFMVMLWV
jgi:tetratricopeptide (TPR) repeat protein